MIEYPSKSNINKDVIVEKTAKLDERESLQFIPAHKLKWPPIQSDQVTIPAEEGNFMNIFSFLY